MTLGTLKLVATPIGNLRDITLRAIDEIKNADVIFAEDTRHTLQLIKALGIELKSHCHLISCDSHKEKARVLVAIERLKASDSVVFMSDAGCPGISDPGSMLARGVIEQGFSVEVIPGPSAITAAVMGAGLDTSHFAFLGFLPQKKKARQKAVINAAKADLALVIYESPLRVADLLNELYDYLGTRKIVVARELTKLYETFHRGELGGKLSPPLLEKGECVVVVERLELRTKASRAELEEFIKEALASNESPKDIAKKVRERFNLKKTDAYNLVLELK